MSFYYTKQGYALLAEKSGSTHYFGGEVCHQGAMCPVCKLPLLLLADLDCVSLRKMEKAKLFRNLDRLPLYYCWRCCAEKLSYQVNDHSTVSVLKNEGKPQGDAFPYTGFPRAFERRPVKLVPIPYATAKLLAVAQEVDNHWLADQDLKAIQRGLKHFRHSGFSKNQINRHQIGGLLNLIQGHEYVPCPNPACQYHNSAERGYGPKMRELAVIHNDPLSGLPMFEELEELSDPSRFNEFVQVVYWVCEECLTIAASNRCD